MADSILTSVEFLRAAKQRLTTAEFLLDQGYSLDGFYLGGYSVECALKALIMERTAEAERQTKFERITSRASMHYAEQLKQELYDVGCTVPLDLVKRLRRFNWSTSLRYKSGRHPRGEVRGFLKAAKAVIDWVEGEMP